MKCIGLGHKSNSCVITTTNIFDLDTHTMKISEKRKKNQFIVINIKNIG